MLKNHGYFILTHGLMATFFPAFAPKIFNNETFREEKGKKDALKKEHLRNTRHLS
jgi:hypothetical protein